jgi:glycolate oxidase
LLKDEEEGKKLWFARRNASPATMIYGTKKLNEDISVPRSKLPVALDGFIKLVKNMVSKFLVLDMQEMEISM